MASTDPKTDDTKLQVDHVEVVLSMESPESNEKSIWTLLAEHPRVLLYALLANSSSLLYGYDILTQGAITALEAFVLYYGSEYEGSVILPALWQGLWQAFSSMGIMVGSASNGVLQDRFGRRPMLFVGGVVSAIGTAVIFTSCESSHVDTRRGILLLGKFILGAGIGIELSTCQTYVSEIAPPRLRTILLGFFPFLLCLGQMIAINVVFAGVMDITSHAFKVPFASQWAFSGLTMAVAFLVPESPVYLISNSKNDQGVSSLKRLYGSKANVAQLAQIIQSTIDQEKANEAENNDVSYADCFKGSDARRTRIVALLNTLQQLIGVSLISNSTYFFIMAGMSSKQSLTVNQIGVGLSMAGTLVAWPILTKFGRRTTILGGFVVASVFFLAMGIVGCFPHHTSALNFLGVSIILVGLTSNLSVGTAYPIAAAEIPSTRLRAKSLGVGFFVNAFMSWVFAFCVPYMFNSDEGDLGGKIGFIFFGMCLIGFFLSWREIPETKNVTYAHLDYMFQKGTPAREFNKMATARGAFVGDMKDEK